MNLTLLFCSLEIFPAGVIVFQRPGATLSAYLIQFLGGEPHASTDANPAWAISIER